ncbi:salicylate synthase [Streptomyces tubbatahanensis]|uniref:Salicylate synthase n=1 Tax=Streptomyces tubbatahanensis TaxID=2923272 RepID=A0ABY3XX75_9ACTN|nr:salicylate synthase [Streptomyces tubbatahanensis]UNS99090.1 salicylate synthase [Streptomyces tubbatahanensis]
MPQRRRYLERELSLSLPPLHNAMRLVESLWPEGGHVVFERNGRYSVCGDLLGEVRLQSGRVRAWCDGVLVTDEEAVDPLRQLNACLRAFPLASWRAYGWAAFELGCALAGLPVGDEPLAHLAVPATEVVLEEGGARVRALSEQSLDAVCALLTAPAAERPHNPAPAPEKDIAPARAAIPVPLDPDAPDDPRSQTYRAAVRLAVDDIRAGLLQKVILSRTVPVDFPVDLAATYAHGRAHNTPARSFLLDLGGVAAAGFSPETVVEVEGSRVTTQPLAGTRRRSPDRAETLRLREELYASEKEIYEHAISVKTSVDELGTVCEPGSVQVSDYMSVRERGSVQHLASSVSGELAPGRTAWAAFAAAFPAVTASGVPKRAAYDCMRRLETGPRGLYAGAVLTVDSEGEMDAALVLRSVYRSAGRCWLRAGAGIVAGSTPEREYEETCEKLESIAHHLVPGRDQTHANTAGDTEAAGAEDPAPVRAGHLAKAGGA